MYGTGAEGSLRADMYIHTGSSRAGREEVWGGVWRGGSFLAAQENQHRRSI